MQIVVLYGGKSAEREVSLCSGKRVCEALEGVGHQITGIDVLEEEATEEILTCCKKAQAVFLCFHGGSGEDGRWQSALERQQVYHYTGSGSKASALAMDKLLSKEAVAKLGVKVALGGDLEKARSVGKPCDFPCIIKPRYGGSSVGFLVIKNEEEWEKLIPLENYLYEEYLPGQEYSVGVLQGRALPPVAISPLSGEYDYHNKYTPGATREICPAPVDVTRLAELQNLALVCFCALGLRDFARIDFREDANGNICFLEANTLPGMTQTSLLPLAAKTAGIDFPQLCERMAQMAFLRKHASSCGR